MIGRGGGYFGVLSGGGAEEDVIGAWRPALPAVGVVRSSTARVILILNLKLRGWCCGVVVGAGCWAGVSTDLAQGRHRDAAVSRGVWWLL